MVEYSSLALALLLPWMGGYLLLAGLEGRFGLSAATLRQVGLGLFLGYAALDGIVTAYDAATGSVALWPILSIVTLCCIPGAVLFLKRETTSPVGRTDAGEGAWPHWRVLFWILAAWTALHLLLVAVEIIWRPTFPWDAWTSWLYRAKAWFYAGALIPLDEPASWVAGVPTAAYNAPGASYPGFTSVMALWSALALAEWHDSLVNFPVLLAGIALALAFYGQIRTAGLPPWLAMLGSYMLVSTPLVGSHLSLGGMADIWMLGFVGLGLVEIISGFLRDERRRLILGVCLVSLALAVKNEGVVWLAACGLVLGLLRWPRLAAAAILCVCAIVGIGALSGVYSVDLPGIGLVGVVGDHLRVPLLGEIGLARLQLGDDYLANFLQGGSWHLLWPLLALALFVLAFAPPDPTRREFVAQLVVVQATQVANFQFTEHGQWAEQWTAINRLPLHVLPALLFALLLVAHQFLVQCAPTGGKVHWSLAPLAGLMVTLGGLLLYLDVSQPNIDAESLNFQGREFKVVVGAGEQHGDSVRVTDFQNGVALLSSGAVALDTAQLSVMELRMRTDRDTPRPMRFFWRTTSDPQQISAIEFPEREFVRSSLDKSIGWQGTVSEFGLMLFGEARKAVVVDTILLAAPSLGNSLRTLWHDWTFQERWGQSSLNFLFVGARDTVVQMPLVVAIWVVVSALLVGMLRRRLAGPVHLVVAIGVAGWLLLDARWTAARLTQAADTLDFYGSADRAYLDLPTGEKQLLERVETSKRLMRDPGATVLVLSPGGESDFLVRRALYHYLPTPGFAHTGTLEEAPHLAAEYALLVTPVNPQPGAQRSSVRALTEDLQRRSGRAVSVLDATDAGVFVRFGPRSE